MAKSKPAKRPQSVQDKTTSDIIQSTWSGPLPPPSLLGHYDNVLPGSAERILTLAEKEQGHRHSLEMQELKANIKFARGDHALIFIGQLFAFIITITFIVSGAYLVVQGAQLAGVFLSSIGVVGIVTAFLKRSSEDNK